MRTSGACKPRCGQPISDVTKKMTAISANIPKASLILFL
jgi:hypothetical protein